MKTLVYWAVCSQADSPGVFRKANDFIKAARHLGMDATSVTPHPGDHISRAMTLVGLIVSKPNLVVLRYNNVMALPLFLVAYALRCRGTKVIFDVATPISAHLKSMDYGGTKTTRKHLELLNAYLLGPLPFISPNLVLEYGNESRYFSLFSRKKRLLIGNGITPDSTEATSRGAGRTISKYVQFLAVGTIAIWHGWDLVLAGLRAAVTDHGRSDIRLDIAGDGPEKKRLEEMVQHMRLDNYVKFHGVLKGEKLQQLYAVADYGIGSFGWSRIGLTVASPLKYREYLANGLPFIYSTRDPDINSSDYVAYELKANAKDIADFMKNCGKTSDEQRKNCEIHCAKKMSFKLKVKKIINAVNFD